MNKVETIPCPVCQSPLSNAVHRRLNSFWSGISVTECPNCETKLEYGSGLKAKLKRAGLFTRAGIIGLVISVALRVIAGTSILVLDAMIGLSFVLLIVGVLMSATKPDQIKVVVSGSAD